MKASFRDIFKTAVRGLRFNKFRSALTVLGIVIGVCAIILVTAIGDGAEELILNQIRGLGAETIVIEPGREPLGPTQLISALSDSLKKRDVEALGKKSNAPAITKLSPLVILPVSVQYRGETNEAVVIGASDIIEDILEIYTKEGSFFTEDDINSRVHAAVIGSEIKKNLFGVSNAIGEKIRIKGRSFQVVGVLPEKGQVTIFNVDKTIVVPHTTALEYLSGNDYYQAIAARVASEKDLKKTVQDITFTLRETHGIEDSSKDDFHITTQSDAAARVRTVTNVLTILLVSVATISLIVGGIGIMNIMMVSISERTREIGIRKALGATERNILVQFLLEAVILTTLGGVVGIASGWFLSYSISVFLSEAFDLKWRFVFPVSAAVIGVVAVVSVGLIFGIYPARKASLKDPVEALYYE